MLSKNHPIVLFIDRNGFTLFQDTQPNIPRFNFTPDIVSNLDVVNREQFSNLIASFIQINKIIPSSLGVILSDNVIYVKDLANGEESQDKIQAFLENIPFEEVLAKVIKTDTVNRIVAVNKDLVTTIIDAFVGKGSSIESVAPSFMYGQNVNFTIGLTQDNVKTILGNLEILRTGNLLTDQKKIVPPAVVENEKNPDPGVKKPQNIRQYILIGVLATLLVIFVVVYLNLGASKTPPPTRKLKSSEASAVIAPTNQPAGGPTLVQTITIAPNDLKNIQLKIVQNSQSEAAIDSMRNNLLTAGFENIIIEASEATPSEKSSIIFSQDISSDVRDVAIREIKKTLFDITILENQEANLTIIVILGKS